MSGYTPLFGSLTTETLCGRWPDIGLWPIVLSLSDRNGVVDVTPAYIASVTGLSLPEVVACMKRFCEPDDYSRSPADDGARLTLLDDHRDWGWKVVNHAYYREKARKAASDAARVASGKEAERKATARISRAVPRCPDAARSVPPSDKTKLNTNEKENGAGAPVVSDPEGLSNDAWKLWQDYRKLKPKSIALAKRKLAAFGADQLAVVEASIANGWQGLFKLRVDLSNGRNDARGSEAAEAWHRLIASDGAVRDLRVQVALEAIGGWQAVRMRTPFDEPRLLAKFSEAYGHGA